MLLKPLFITSILLLFLHLVKDIRSTVNFTQIGLRNRITSARFMNEKKDPYFSKYKEGMSEKFLDSFDDRTYTVSRVTLTPLCLFLFFSPLGQYDYSVIKIIWFIVMWGSLAGCVFLFFKHAKNNFKKKTMVIVIAFYFLSTDSWHFHTERGQMYIIYPLILTIAFTLTQSKYKFKDFAAGFILGISTLLRLPFFLVFVPLLLGRRWKMLAGASTWVLLGLVFCIIFGIMEYWDSYFQAMKEWEKFHFNEMSQNGIPYSDYSVYGEGTNLFLFWNVWDVEVFSVQALILQYLNIRLNSIQLMSMLAISIIIMNMLLFRKKVFSFPKSISNQSIFIFTFLLMLLCEYFLPAPRMNYNFVQWLFILLMLVSQHSQIKALSLTIIILGCFLTFGFTWLTNNQTIGEGLIWLGTFSHLYHQINKEVFHEKQTLN